MNVKIEKGNYIFKDIVNRLSQKIEENCDRILKKRVYHCLVGLNLKNDDAYRNR